VVFFIFPQMPWADPWHFSYQLHPHRISGLLGGIKMEQALNVHDIYKKFGKPGEPFWKRVLHRSQSNRTDGQNGSEGKNGHNGSNHNGNGHTRNIVAVDHVTFTIHPGEIFGVLGPNGGGKSTLIRLISTLLLPDQGQISVFGYDVVRDSMEVRRRINRVSVEASFFKKLSPAENLMYGARLYGMNGADTRIHVLEILTRLGIEKRSIYNPMEEMSRGMQQKVAVARALLSRPQLLLLDEPTTGLDPRSKREVQEIVKELREKHGTTILLTTHDMIEAEALCDRIAIMDKGRVVALDTPENLRTLVPVKNGQTASLEDVFLELTGRALDSEEEHKEK
jgi:ABC-2 type transport system ATP-binding protein